MMKNNMKFLAAAALALFVSVPAAFAQTPEYSTLPVTEPTEIGGTVLQPGTYLIRVLRSNSDRNKVQVTSADMKTVYATVLTVPHQLEPGEEMPNTMFVFYPAGEGMPRALRTWFAPDPKASQGGHDIVYEESRAKQLARLAKSPVVSYRGEAVADLGVTELHRITPEATVEAYPVIVTPAPAPVVMPPAQTSASTTQVEPAPVQVADSRPVEMPKTAGNVPLIALTGLLLVGAAAALRFTRGA